MAEAVTKVSWGLRAEQATEVIRAIDAGFG
jgi:hypothetical protein